MDEVVEALEKYQGLVPLVYDIEIMGLVEARPQDMQYAVYLKREADKVIAHQKYKRCLAMAMWCASRVVVWTTEGNEKKSNWYWKWKEKWLELAEKYKEGNV